VPSIRQRCGLDEDVLVRQAHVVELVEDDGLEAPQVGQQHLGGAGGAGSTARRHSSCGPCPRGRELGILPPPRVRGWGTLREDPTLGGYRFDDYQIDYETESIGAAGVDRCLTKVQVSTLQSTTATRIRPLLIRGFGVRSPGGPPPDPRKRENVRFVRRI
jgi:hypothetical protein